MFPVPVACSPVTRLRKKYRLDEVEAAERLEMALDQLRSLEAHTLTIPKAVLIRMAAQLIPDRPARRQMVQLSLLDATATIDTESAQGAGRG